MRIASGTTHPSASSSSLGGGQQPRRSPRIAPVRSPAPSAGARANATDPPTALMIMSMRICGLNSTNDTNNGGGSNGSKGRMRDGHRQDSELGMSNSSRGGGSSRSFSRSAEVGPGSSRNKAVVGDSGLNNVGSAGGYGAGGRVGDWKVVASVRNVRLDPLENCVDGTFKPSFLGALWEGTAGFCDKNNTVLAIRESNMMTDVLLIICIHLREVMKQSSHIGFISLCHSTTLSRLILCLKIGYFS